MWTGSNYKPESKGRTIGTRVEGNLRQTETVTPQDVSQEGAVTVVKSFVY